MPYLPILMMVACAIFFHRAAEFENESSLMWTGLSVVISVMTLFVFRWGLAGLPARPGWTFPWHRNFSDAAQQVLKKFCK